MTGPSYTLSAPLKVMRGMEGVESAYIEFTGEQADRIAAQALTVKAAGAKLRFGSFKVFATIGEMRWDSALYPQKDGTWFLPVKKPIRLAEQLDEGTLVSVQIEVQ